MRICCDCCLLMLWARSIRATLGDPQVVRDILMQRARDPIRIRDKDFFRECAWAIYTSGINMNVVEQRWDQLEQAFSHWDYQQVCRDETSARTAAMRIRVRNYNRKADAVIQIAQWMCKQGWDAIRRELLYGLTQDAQGNYGVGPNTIPYLDRLPMIGETNAIFVLKNIGYDLAKPDELLKKLAANFDYQPDKHGVQQFALDISKLVLERISVVETVLWNAVHSKADMSFTCPCCGRTY